MYFSLMNKMHALFISRDRCEKERRAFMLECEDLLVCLEQAERDRVTLRRCH